MTGSRVPDGLHISPDADTAVIEYSLAVQARFDRNVGVCGPRPVSYGPFYQAGAHLFYHGRRSHWNQGVKRTALNRPNPVTFKLLFLD